MRYILIIAALFCTLPQISAQNNITYGAGINYTNGAPSFVPPARTSRVAIDTITGKWYHFNTPGGWQLLGNTIEEIAGCSAPAYTPTKGDSRIVINNCTAPELYYWTGSAWVWINEGTTYYAGEGIRIENDTIILDSLNYLQFRTGSALDGSVGRVQWNDTDGTLTLQLKGGNVTLQIGEKEVSLVKHADNTGLTEGKVVYIVGADGTNKTVRYALATADTTSATTFGLMAESATGGNKAFCTTFGLVRNLNTTNLTEGDIVWLSADTAGAMTAVRPIAPKHGVMIGFCVRKHATQGAIFVQVQNGYELNELHDVFVPNPINNQVLTWDNIDKRWEAKTVADSSATNELQTLSTTGAAGNISISSGNTITLNVNDADASPTNELQTLSVAANTATLSNGGGSVTIAGAGINTVGTAGTTITVTGTEVDGSVSNELQTISTGTNTLTLSNGGGTVTVDTDPASDVTGSGVNGRVSFWTGTQTQSSNANFLWDNTNSRATIGPLTSAAYPLEIFRSGTTGEAYSLNISMANPGIRQEVKRGTGGAAFAISESHALKLSDNSTAMMSNIGVLCDFTASPPTSNFLFFGSSPTTAFNDNSIRIYPNKNATIEGNVRIGGHTAPAARLHVVGAGSTSTTWTAQFHNSAGNNNALMIRDDGNVGIGTNNPINPLHISNANPIRSDGGYRVGSQSNNATFFFPFTTSPGTTVATGTNLSFFNYTASLAATEGAFTFGGSPFTQTGSTQYFFRFRHSFEPTSGTAGYVAFGVRPTINQTGGANGQTVGMFIDPQLTNAADWKSILWNNSIGYGLYGSGTATNYLNGNLGLGTTSPTDNLDINGANGYSQLRLRTAYTPTGTADANGNTGDVSWDANYIYIKTAAGWKRSALSTF